MIYSLFMFMLEKIFKTISEDKKCSCITLAIGC